MRAYRKPSIYYRFASKSPYYGHIGTKSVKGYWTIWESRGGQPKPVKINMNDIDIINYKGKLHDIDGENEVQFCICGICQSGFFSVENVDNCPLCQMYSDSISY